MTRKAAKKGSYSQIKFADSKEQADAMELSSGFLGSSSNQLLPSLIAKSLINKDLKYLSGGLECEVTIVSEDFPSQPINPSSSKQISRVNSKADPLRSFYEKYIDGIQRSLNAVDLEDLRDFVDDLIKVRDSGNTIYIFGNGGSAATASHFANDFSKNRFKQKDLLFKVVCLNDCVPLMTALANDCGYDQVFAAQLENLVEPGDMVIGISSSGNSANIINAFDIANKNGVKTWAWVGFDGGKAMQTANRSIYMLSKNGQYGFMEDVSMILNHAVCIFIEEQDKKKLNARK